jgi:hypothetical protein
VESPKKINQRLVKHFGKDINGYPMYRIVQNGKSLTEKRKGNFDIFSGAIFLRTLKDKIVEVPKYTYIKPGFWILEKLFYTEHPDLASKFTYEPVWTFTDPKTGGYQEPVYVFIEFLIKCLERGPTPVMSEEEMTAKEREKIFEFLGGKPGRGNLDGTIADGSAVSMSGLDGKNLQ